MECQTEGAEANGGSNNGVGLLNGQTKRDSTSSVEGVGSESVYKAEV
jgi:hypothetical protein